MADSPTTQDDKIREFVENMGIAIAMWADENLGEDGAARERLAEELSDRAFGSVEIRSLRNARHLSASGWRPTKGNPMTHDYHDGLPGFHPDQILHDGCAECEERGADIALAIGNLDHKRFAAAWERASELYRSGGTLDRTTLSAAEVPLLRVLWAIIVQFEGRGIQTTDIPGEDVELVMARRYG